VGDNAGGSDFVDAFFEVVDWEEPHARFEQAVELFE